MAMSHQRLRQATISSILSNTPPRRNNITPKVKSLSRRTPHRTPTRANSPALPLPNTNPLNSLKQTPLIHHITLPRMHPVNLSMLNTKTSRVQVLTESLPEHLVIHPTNPIDRLQNLEQRGWELEINQQLGRLTIDNKLNRVTRFLNRGSILLNMVLRPILPNSSKVRDLVVMDMAMCPLSKDRLME
jgi:hypothetical protein